MKRIIKHNNSLFWSIVFGMAMLVLMLPARPHSNLSVRAQTDCVPPPAGMVGWWPGDGDTFDILGGNHGSLGGTVSFLPGRVAEAFNFDSDDDRVTIPHNTAFDVQTPGFSVDFWMKGTKNAGADSVSAMLDKSHELFSNTGWTFEAYNSDGLLLFAISNGVEYPQALASGVDVLDNQFHHVAGTWDGTTIRLYVDGVLAGTRASSTVANNTGELAFGSLVGGGRNYRGILDEVEIFNRALSESEIQSLFNAGSVGKCKAPDSDNDGVFYPSDNCPTTSNPDQADADGDGVGDACDTCPNDPSKINPGACGCGVPDTDSDEDGTPDCSDGCPNDPQKTDPGACGCGTPDVDSDRDGTLDCLDRCPTDRRKTDPGICGCGVRDTDTDRDGVPDCVDNCLTTTNPGQEDADHDGVGDACDTCMTHLEGLGPVRVWIGLKNSDDVGTKFDLLAEVLKNGLVIGSGQLEGVAGGSSGFNNAILRTINLALSSPADFCSGGTLSFRLSVRIAANSGHVSGTARLWYNDSAANSRFTATVGGTPVEFFLLNGFTLDTSAGPGPKKTIDVSVNRNVVGNPFKPFGTWSKTF